MGKDTPTGRIFEADDLTMLLEQGHELGCHTYSHCHSWETKPAAFEESVLENRAALRRIIPKGKFRNFSYPITLPRPMTKARITDYFLCCRGGGQALNVGKVDLNQVSAYFLEKGRHNAQAIKNLIDQNRQVRGWLIFATHDISDIPTPFGCTPDLFEQVVEYVVKSGAQILSVIKALEALGAPNSRPASGHAHVPDSRVEDHRSAGTGRPLESKFIPTVNARGGTD